VNRDICSCVAASGRAVVVGNCSPRWTSMRSLLTRTLDLEGSEMLNGEVLSLGIVGPSLLESIVLIVDDS